MSNEFIQILDAQQIEPLEAEIVDKVTLWMLRLILKEGGHRELIDQDGDFEYRSKDVALFFRFTYFTKNISYISEFIQINHHEIQSLIR